MITEARIDNLLRLIRNNENAPGFYLGDFVCGSWGCLVGNDWLVVGGARHPSDLNPGRSFMEWSSLEYGVERRIWQFLFAEWSHKRNEHGVMYLCSNNRRPQYDREAAINRVRKFLYYVMHKRELLYDDSGKVRETARRAEGNHNVLASVKAAVERKERELVTA